MRGTIRPMRRDQRGGRRDRPRRARPCGCRGPCCRPADEVVGSVACGGWRERPRPSRTRAPRPAARSGGDLRGVAEEVGAHQHRDAGGEGEELAPHAVGEAEARPRRRRPPARSRRPGRRAVRGRGGPGRRCARRRRAPGARGRCRSRRRAHAGRLEADGEAGEAGGEAGQEGEGAYGDAARTGRRSRAAVRSVRMAMNVAEQADGRREDERRRRDRRRPARPASGSRRRSVRRRRRAGTGAGRCPGRRARGSSPEPATATFGRAPRPSATAEPRSS